MITLSVQLREEGTVDKVMLRRVHERPTALMFNCFPWKGQEGFLLSARRLASVPPLETPIPGTV